METFNKSRWSGLPFIFLEKQRVPDFYRKHFCNLLIIGDFRGFAPAETFHADRISTLMDNWSSRNLGKFLGKELILSLFCY